jgi:heat shock protein HslJ
LVVLALAGCVVAPPAYDAQTPAQAATPAPAPTQAQAATPAVKATSNDAKAIPAGALRNATYGGIYEKPVTLKEGVYEGKPFAPNDPSRPTVTYIDGAELQGDLDGDGVDDAVVFLLDRAGGTGAFTWVAAQLNRAGKPVDAGAVMVEDRIGVRSAAIENGQVVLDIITQGPGDVACCGTHKARKTYALQGGRLVETTTAGGDLVKVSAADLNGTSWNLLELKEGQPVTGDAQTTISFQGGRVTGSGGCNSYTGSFSLDGVNPFAMTTGPVVAAQKACPEPILSQEAAYFAALQNVSQWGYVFGRLALYYGDGQGKLGRLLFAPAAPAGSLTAHPWQWIAYEGPMEKFEVTSPANYTAAFSADGTLNIVADCNRASGSYKSADGSLQVQIGPATMALCPGDSRGEQFVKYLGSAARAFFKDGKLYIDLFADGGTLAFAPTAK